MKQISLILAFLVSFSNVAIGQSDSTKMKTLAINDSLGVRLIKLSSCEKKQSSYFVISNNDSLLVRYWATCFSYNRPNDIDTAKFEFRQIDKIGKPELLLEYKYSFESRYGTELIIINLDSMTIMFRTDIEAYYPAEYEPPANPKLIKNKIFFTEQGDIKVQNYFEPAIFSEFRLVNGGYLPMDK
jgi:hypothetical protein